MAFPVHVLEAKKELEKSATAIENVRKMVYAAAAMALASKEAKTLPQLDIKTREWFKKTPGLLTEIKRNSDIIISLVRNKEVFKSKRWTPKLELEWGFLRHENNRYEMLCRLTESKDLHELSTLEKMWKNVEIGCEAEDRETFEWVFWFLDSVIKASDLDRYHLLNNKGRNDLIRKIEKQTRLLKSIISQNNLDAGLLNLSGIDRYPWECLAIRKGLTRRPK